MSLSRDSFSHRHHHHLLPHCSLTAREVAACLSPRPRLKRQLAVDSHQGGHQTYQPQILWRHQRKERGIKGDEPNLTRCHAEEAGKAGCSAFGHLVACGCFSHSAMVSFQLTPPFLNNFKGNQVHCGNSSGTHFDSPSMLHPHLKGRRPDAPPEVLWKLLPLFFLANLLRGGFLCASLLLRLWFPSVRPSERRSLIAKLCCRE